MEKKKTAKPVSPSKKTLSKESSTKKFAVKKAVKEPPKPSKKPSQKIKRIVKIVPPKNPIGTPTKYRPEYCQIVKALAASGMIDREICSVLNVTQATLINWKRDHPELVQAFAEGKAIPDTKIEMSLFRRATGTEVEEIIRDRIYNPETEKQELVETRRILKQIPPDPTSMIFWLKNRKPKDWRDKQDVEHSGSIGYKVMPDEIEEETKE